MTEVHPHFFLSGPAPNNPYLYPAAPGILENALAYLRLVQEDHGYMQDIARPLVREPDEENFMEEDEEVGQENHAYMQNVAGPLVRQPDEGDAQNVEGTLMAHEGDQQADPILVVENNNQCNHLDKYTTASMFLARVQHRSCLPQATVDNIKDETCALVQNILQRLHIKVNSALEGYCSPALMNTVSEYFQDEINPFDDLDTAYRQKKFFETLFPLVVSIQLWFIFIFIVMANVGEVIFWWWCWLKGCKRHAIRMTHLVAIYSPCFPIPPPHPSPPKKKYQN